MLTCGLEDTGVALAVPLGKRLHHPVDLLRFPGQPETPQELPARSEVSRCFGGSTQPLSPLTSLRPPASPLPVLPAVTRLSCRPLHSPQGLHEVEVSELVQLHEGMQDLDVELVPAGTRPEHEGCVISQSCDCQAAPRLPAPLQAQLVCGGKMQLAPTPVLGQFAHTSASQ